MDETLLQGTLSGTTTSKTKKPSVKLRQSIIDMMERRKDPGFVKYAHYAMGYSPDEIEKELGYYSQYTGQQGGGGQQNLSDIGKAVMENPGLLKDLTPTERTAIIPELNSAGFKFGGGSATSGLDAETKKMADTMITAKNLLTPLLEKEEIEGVGGLGSGSAQAFLAKNLGYGTEEGETNRNIIANAKAAIAKLRGGTSFTPNEEKLLDAYTPSINDSDLVVKTKIKNLNSFIDSYFNVATGKSLSEFEQKEKEMETAQTQRTAPWSPKEDQQALEWAKANPNDPRAKQIYSFLGQPAEVEPATSGVSPALPSSSPNLSPTDEKGTVEPKKGIGEKIGSFLGGDEVGEAIGNKLATVFSKYGEAGDIFKSTVASIEQKFKDGKITQQERDKYLDATEKNAKEAFGYDGPNLKEFVGDLAQAGLTVGTMAVGAPASFVGKVVAGAATGYGFDVAQGLQDDETVGEALKPGIGTAVGTAVPFLGGALRRMTKVKTLPNERVKKAVGQIIQGEKKDIPKAIETLKRIDKKGVRTYEDLTKRVKENMTTLGDTMDNILAEDKTKYPLASLTKATKVGDKTIKTNYVKEALDGLKELYQKSSDAPNAERIGQLIKKSKTAGLTLQEVNGIAKEYGRSGNAFTKAGELKKTASSVSFENIRKGVKDTLRAALPDERSKAVDKAFHENMRTTELLETMDEKVNKLMQRVEERGLFEKGGRFVGKIAEKIPVVGGGAKGFLQAFIPSNAGNKTMNAIALQDALKSNLKIIEKNGEKISQKIAERVSGGGKISHSFIQNILRDFKEND